jgi:hypothetical protein
MRETNLRNETLILAAFLGYQDIASTLLDAGTHRKWDSGALKVAAFNGHADVVQLLLDTGLDNDD